SFTVCFFLSGKISSGLRLMGSATIVWYVSPAASPLYSSIAITEGSSTVFFKRSEEHTSELQSRFELVCRLLLERKNSRRRFATLPHLVPSSPYAVRGWRHRVTS